VLVAAVVGHLAAVVVVSVATVVLQRRAIGAGE